MEKREKVIKGLGETLRYCHEMYNGCNNDGQYKLARMNQAAKDALALLKEQEPEALDMPKPDSEIGCWYDITHNYTLEQVVSALKEQEPHVMTLEEIKALPDYVFLEDRDISHAFSIKTISRPALPQLVFVNISGEECVGFRGPDGDTSLVTSRYGVEWRCWTSRPARAQMEAVKWE